MISSPPSTRRTVATTLVLVAVAAGFWLLYRLAGVAFDVFFAIVIGTALRPWADALARWGLSRRAAGLVFAALILATLATALIILVPTLLEEASAVTGQLPEHLEGLRRWLSTSPSATVRQLGREIPPSLVAPFPKTLSGVQAVGYVGSAAEGLLHLVAVSLLAFYWLGDGDLLARTLLLCVQEPRREAVRRLAAEVESMVGDFVRGQLLVCSAAATMSVAGYFLIGLPDALLLGVFFGVMAVFPVVGAPLGALPAVVVALSTRPSLLPWVVLVAAVVHVIQDYVLAPRILGRRVRVSPFTVILAVTAFVPVIGVAGAVLAVPLAAIVQLLLDRFVFSEPLVPFVPAARDRLGVLRLKAVELVNDVRKQARENGERPDESYDKAADLMESLASAVERRLAERCGGPEPTP